MKKLLTSLAALVVILVCFAMLPTRAQAAEVASGAYGPDGDNITWTLDDNGTLTICGNGPMWPAPSWEIYCSLIKNVVIVDGITSIGEGAFRGCNSLTNITIPNSITDIYNNAFHGCSSLTNVNIPNSVTCINQFAFRNCISLTNIAIPNSVTSIDNGAFSGCTNLRSITVDSKNTTYHSKGNCLIETASKTLINGFSNSVIPSDGSVTSIGYWAFCGCANLTSITIPDSVTSIDEQAFFGCSSLTNITISNSVTSIGEQAFSGCSSMASISVDSGNPVYHSKGNCLIETAYKTLLVGCLNSVIPSDGSVTSIGNYAFFGCSGLTSINIPDSVTIFGDYAFYECTSLTNITIPPSVTRIGDYAFYKCTSLWHVLYKGNEQYWNAIDIDKSSNRPLLTATLHYNCTGNEITDPVNKVCTICTPACSHAYDNACDTACNLCGATRTTSHTPGPAATATKDQTCTVCGKVLNKATGGTTTTPPATDPPATAPTTEPSNTPTEPTTDPTTEPVESTPPTESATEPVESTPAETDPSGTDATQPEDTATTPGNPAESETDNTIVAVIVSCVACLLLGAGGAIAGIILWKKKH